MYICYAKNGVVFATKLYKKKYQENISDITCIESSREEEDDDPTKDDPTKDDDPPRDDPATEEELPRSIITGAPLFAQNTRSKWR